MVTMWPITPLPNASQAFAGTQIGNNFTASASQDVDVFTYYRSVLSDGAPSYLRLWNVTDAVSIIELTAPTDPGGTGWLEFPMGATHTLVTGKTYCVTYFVQGGNTGWGWSTGPPTPNSPFTVTGVRFNGDHTTIPTSVSSWEAAAVGVGQASGGGGGGTATLNDADIALIDGDLAKWLSANSTTNTQHSDIPWLTWQTVTSGLNLAGGLQALSDSLAHTIQMASDYFAGRTATYFTDLKNRLIGASGGGGSAFYGPDGTQVADGVEQLLARPAPTAVSNPAPGTFPGAGWTMTDETDFTLCVAYDQPADLYVITCDEATIAPKPEEACGVTRYRHLLWHAILNGDFLQERHFGDFAKLHVTDGGRRMPGLYVKIYAGGDGHIQAWRYAP